MSAVTAKTTEPAPQTVEEALKIVCDLLTKNKEKFEENKTDLVGLDASKWKVHYQGKFSFTTGKLYNSEGKEIADADKKPKELALRGLTYATASEYEQYLETVLMSSVFSALASNEAGFGVFVKFPVVVKT